MLAPHEIEDTIGPEDVKGQIVGSLTLAIVSLPILLFGVLIRIFMRDTDETNQ